MAYVSKIMSKNFRKEGQPEKERIANITGMNIDKVPIHSLLKSHLSIKRWECRASFREGQPPVFCNNNNTGVPLIIHTHNYALLLYINFTYMSM